MKIAVLQAGSFTLKGTMPLNDFNIPDFWFISLVLKLYALILQEKSK